MTFPHVKDSPVSKIPAIADTGYLVALLRREDEHHEWATELAGEFQLPLLTCEAVLAEAAFHLQSSASVLRMVQRGALRISFDCLSNLGRLQDLAARYADRRPDLADLCLIRMSELYPQHLVITIDESDFRVYRRNKREVIPLICPPAK
ncbi:MAG: PIN domain-containing protein [Terriglobales bacterium]